MDDEICSNASYDDMGIVSVSSGGSYQGTFNHTGRLSVSSWYELDSPSLSSCPTHSPTHARLSTSPTMSSYYVSPVLGCGGTSPLLSPPLPKIVSTTTPGHLGIPEPDHHSLLDTNMTNNVLWNTAKIILSTVASSLLIVDPSVSLGTTLSRTQSSSQHKDYFYYEQHDVASNNHVNRAVVEYHQASGGIGGGFHPRLFNALISPFSTQLKWLLGGFDKYLDSSVQSFSSPSSNSDAMDTLGTRLFLSNAPDLDGFIH